MFPSSAFVPRAAGLALLLSLVANPLAAQTGTDDLSQGLIRLRGEVEQLNSELELLREEQRSTLAALGAQRAELSASSERQQLAVREARQKLETIVQQQAESGVAGDVLKPVLLSALDALANQVRSGLPFKTEERLGELQQFRSQIENGTLPPQRAVNRLWAFYEDEFRLTRENALHAQTIAIGDERILADVARLGAMALYFEAPDGRLGQARREGDGWRFVVNEDATQQKQIAALFDSLRKQIRQGYFELPLLTERAQ